MKGGMVKWEGRDEQTSRNNKCQNLSILPSATTEPQAATRVAFPFSSSNFAWAFSTLALVLVAFFPSAAPSTIFWSLFISWHVSVVFNPAQRVVSVAFPCSAANSLACAAALVFSLSDEVVVLAARAAVRSIFASAWQDSLVASAAKTWSQRDVRVEFASRVARVEAAAEADAWIADALAVSLWVTAASFVAFDETEIKSLMREIWWHWEAVEVELWPLAWIVELWPLAWIEGRERRIGRRVVSFILTRGKAR
jgi:hypothetical protein